MSVQLNPYLSFKDNARQAMEFYQTVFSGTLSVDTFGQFHASEDPAEAEKVMHAQLTAPNGIVFMASDTPNSMEFKPGASISMSLSGDDDATLSGYFQQLSDGGSVTMPLENAPWGDKFGACVDKFGVNWMVNISKPGAPTADTPAADAPDEITI
jgi:PhnB protein